MSMATKKSSQYSAMVRLYPSPSKWICLGCFTGILLPLVHLLQEGLGFLLIHKGETCQAILEFEGVEKSPVLVV